MDDCKHGVLPDKENVIPFLIYGCYKIGRIDMGERFLKDMGKWGYLYNWMADVTNGYFADVYMINLCFYVYFLNLD
jgi:hypothetical protein